jgi:hypothetical protein
MLTTYDISPEEIDTIINKNIPHLFQDLQKIINEFNNHNKDSLPKELKSSISHIGKIFKIWELKKDQIRRETKDHVTVLETPSTIAKEELNANIYNSVERFTTRQLEIGSRFTCELTQDQIRRETKDHVTVLETPIPTAKEELDYKDDSDSDGSISDVEYDTEHHEKIDQLLKRCEMESSIARSTKGFTIERKPAYVIKN